MYVATLRCKFGTSTVRTFEGVGPTLVIAVTDAMNNMDKDFPNISHSSSGWARYDREHPFDTVQLLVRSDRRRKR